MIAHLQLLLHYRAITACAHTQQKPLSVTIGLQAELGIERASQAVSEAVDLFREMWNVDRMIERIPQLGLLTQAPGPVDAGLRVHIHPSSVLGMHIRRCVASYTVMTYEVQGPPPRPTDCADPAGRAALGVQVAVLLSHQSQA